MSLYLSLDLSKQLSTLLQDTPTILVYLLFFLCIISIQNMMKLFLIRINTSLVKVCLFHRSVNPSTVPQVWSKIGLSDFHLIFNGLISLLVICLKLPLQMNRLHSMKCLFMHKWVLLFHYYLNQNQIETKSIELNKFHKVFFYILLLVDHPKKKDISITMMEQQWYIKTSAVTLFEYTLSDKILLFSKFISHQIHSC